MTEPHPGVPRAPRGTGPVASLSAAALRHNVALLSSAADPTSAAAADAWGHGLEWVARVAGGDALAHGDGATLYGLPGGHPEARPVLRLSGTVLSTKDLRAGEGVSYGYTHRAPADTRVALVTGGYAQGIVRSLGNRVAVRLGGALHPIVGRVAMDVCVVDIGSAPIARGERAVFFGDPLDGDPSLAVWETASGLTAAELVTAVGLHVPREETA